VVHLAGLIKARTDREFLTVNRDGTARLSALAPDALFLLLSSLAAREPQLSPYAASKRAAEDAVAARKRSWLAVRAPAVYGPGDRETLTYFRAVAHGFALEPRISEARLALLHVADLAEVLALCLEGPPVPSVYEIDDGREGGYRYADMADAASQALGRRARSLRVPRGVMATVAAANRLTQRLGGPAQILSKGKVNEIFHSDWSIHDRRLAKATDFAPSFSLADGFRHTISWYRDRGWL
jgi:nucleoside-diphosphate-sugar epimerase